MELVLVCHHNCLYYFENMTDKELGRIILVENLNIQEVDKPHKLNCFELCISNNMGNLTEVCKTGAGGRGVYLVLALMQAEKDKWIKSIQAAVSIDPFCEMLMAREKLILSRRRNLDPLPPTPLLTTEVPCPEPRFWFPI